MMFADALEAGLLFTIGAIALLVVFITLGWPAVLLALLLMAALRHEVRIFIAALAGVLFVVTLLTLLLVLAGVAHARWKPEYAELSPSVRGWYENTTVTKAAHERLGFWGCCKESEVVKTTFRVDRSSGDDQWFWLKSGQWKRVPPDIIHWGESAPNGEATLFVLDKPWGGNPTGTETCFYPPRGGL